MIRFPTHDGRGAFTLALTASHQSTVHTVQQHWLSPGEQSLLTPSSKALSTHASTSSSILDDALPRQAHPSMDLSQRIQAWTQEQQYYTRLRYKRRRLSYDVDQRIPRQGLEGWLWRFVSKLIKMDDELLQIVLGEKLCETEDKTVSENASFWEGFLQRTSMERHLASPFPAPYFQQAFRAQHDTPAPTSSSPAQSRPARTAPTPWDAPSHRRNLPAPNSSWSSIPPDPIQTAPFNPTPIHQSHSRTDSSHAPWGIEENDILSRSTELPDDYWDRELTIPLVWHLVKNYISARLPVRTQEAPPMGASCKEESIRGRWDDPAETGYYWHESVDGASSLGLGLGGLGTWAEV